MSDNTPPEGQNGPSEPLAGDPGVNTSPDDPGPQNGNSDIKDPELAAYIKSLREEVKDNRIKAQQREDVLNAEIRRYATKEAATAAGLVDPDAIIWADEFNGENGLPDLDRLTTAAAALVKSRPWLARARGPLPGQGEHSTAEPGLSLSELLRA